MKTSGLARDVVAIILGITVAAILSPSLATAQTGAPASKSRLRQLLARRHNPRQSRAGRLGESLWRVLACRRRAASRPPTRIPNGRRFPA
jgi:hypothetical protein